MNYKYLEPLYEIGALIQFCEKYEMVEKIECIKRDMPDLARIYYKVRDNLSDEALEVFEIEVQKAYDRFLQSLLSEDLQG